MTESLTPPENRGGRPRVRVTQEQVRALRNDGVSGSKSGRHPKLAQPPAEGCSVTARKFIDDLALGSGH